MIKSMNLGEVKIKLIIIEKLNSGEERPEKKNLELTMIGELE